MTGTAQVLGNILTAAAKSGDGSWLGVVKYLLAGLCALASPFVIQEITEYVIAVFKVPFYLKFLIPKILSSAVSGLLIWTGVPADTATEAGVALMGLVKLVNESKWGLDLEAKFASARAAVPSTPKSAAILLALMVGAGSLHADVTPTAKAGWCAGPSLFGGSAIWQANSENALVPTASTVGGVQFTGYLGSWVDQTFNPTYYFGILGGMDTAGGLQQPAIGITAGYNGAGIFAAKLLGPDSGGLIFGVEGVLQFSGYVPFLYLGKPGN